jgi:hypothetical protein
MTPSLPPGHYVVTADLTVTGSSPHDSGRDSRASEVVCWTTPSSAGVGNNRDGVNVAASLGAGAQTLSLYDLLTTTLPTDQIDLACRVTGGSGDNAGQQADVTAASIIALQVADTTSTS